MRREEEGHVTGSEQHSDVGDEAGEATGGKGEARFGKMALLIAFFPTLSFFRSLPGPFE
jgi:hypothetical protein